MILPQVHLRNGLQLQSQPSTAQQGRCGCSRHIPGRTMIVDRSDGRCTPCAEQPILTGDPPCIVQQSLRCPSKTFRQDNFALPYDSSSLLRASASPTHTSLLPKSRRSQTGPGRRSQFLLHMLSPIMVTPKASATDSLPL